jgi:hypothetical protein
MLVLAHLFVPSALCVPEEWERRAAELRPIFIELAVLSDWSLASVLTERRIPTLKGGKKWQEIQVARLRTKLNLDKRREKARAFYKRVLKLLLESFGRDLDERADYDYLLVDHCAYLIFQLYALNQILSGDGDISGLSEQQLADYERLVQQLCLVLAAVKIASGFEIDADTFADMVLNPEVAAKVAAQLRILKEKKPSALPVTSTVGPFTATLTLTMDAPVAGSA